ncbi:MAG: hypothetical protein KIT61_17420 [Pyrinomonadaceae bacterium]|nr:hypothetical protein [Pyrinomonadaceae bacterium]
MKYFIRLRGKILLFVFSLLVFLTFAVNAQIGIVDRNAKVKPTLVILGSYRMANPGRDRARSEVDDVLQPARQREITRLVELLGRFKPTKIAVECSPKYQPKIDSDYQKYLKGEGELKKGEEEQIGFRLAKQMRLAKLYCIDWNDYPPGDFSNYDYDEFSQKDPELKSFLEEITQKLQESVAQNGKILTKLSIVEQYRFLNKPENLDHSHQRYFDFVRIGRGDQYIGANYLSHWYGRNMKILANLIRSTDSLSDRIFVIYGQGHAKLLTQFAEESGFYTVESPLKYLKSKN